MGVTYNGREQGVERMSQELDKVTKHLVAACKGSALRVLGISSAEVADLWPTEWDDVDFRRGMLDLVLRLEDDTLLHLEFQSTRERALHRFALYDLQLHQAAGRTIKTVVLYENGVKSAPDMLDIGSALYRVQNVYLAERDGSATLRRIAKRLEEGQWSVEDRAELPFVMHMRHEGETRERVVERCLELMDRIPDRDERSYTAALFLGISLKYLTDEEKEQLKARVKAMVDLVKEIAEEEFAKGEAKGEAKKAVDVAKAMLADGADITRIARYTGLSVEELERLRKEMSN